MNEQELYDSLSLSTKAICKEVGEIFHTEFDNKSIELISELVWGKLEIYSSDLELFAKHGKRNLINASDVLLLARRNDSLKNLLKTVVDELPVPVKEVKKKKQ